MMLYPVIEKFLSIDGEGPTAGCLAAFIRFQGCNLRCSWCDTTYSFDESGIREYLTAEEILAYIRETEARNVTLTGGEPLITKGIGHLLELLDREPMVRTHVETNGSVAVRPFIDACPGISYIVDYKLNGSGMSGHMCRDNLRVVREMDAYKFVVAGKEDLIQAEKIIREEDLDNRTQVFLSPVLGSIDPAEIVDFMKERKLVQTRLQIQLHKVIWDPDLRGV